jgi:hypothetical protein
MFPPPVLVWANRVSLADMRPWDYDAMSFWDYERIRITQVRWLEAQRAKPMHERTTPSYNQPLTPGEGGPQFYDDDDDDDDDED